MTDEVRNFTRIEMVEHHPDLDKIYKHYLKLSRAAAPGTWPALFRTSNHKRMKARQSKMAKRFIAAVSKKFNITYWIHEKVKNVGPSIIWDEEKNK